MHSDQTKRAAPLALALALFLAGLTLAGCRSNDPAGSDVEGATGDISIDGSSTVYPITQAVAEDFAKESDVNVNVAFSGTGGGFEKFCRGEIQISNASRGMKREEAEVCLQAGISDILELQVAVDALTVVVNPENDFVQCLTTPDLHMIFKSDGAAKWSDIDPSWPDETINTYYPGTDSGTFDYFNEQVILKQDPAATHRGDGTASEDDNIIAQGVQNDANAIGYFGFAYYQGAGSNLRAVEVDHGFGCVAPTFETAVANQYLPLARPLFIYTRKGLLSAPDSTVLDFVEFYMENAAELVAEVGYITMPPELVDEQNQKLAEFVQAPGAAAGEGATPASPAP